jgi:hypothetical protein
MCGFKEVRDLQRRILRSSIVNCCERRPKMCNLKSGEVFKWEMRGPLRRRFQARRRETGLKLSSAISGL